MIKYTSNINSYNNLPGTSFAYWFSKEMTNIFTRSKPLKKDGDTRQGMATSDNNRFLRLWYEVENNKIAYDCESSFSARKSNKKWFPYNKGGEFRKWYGNQEFLINYENDGYEVKEYATKLYKTPSRTIKSMSEYFKECLSWSKISSGKVSFRYYPHGFIFDVAGCCIFYCDKVQMMYQFGFINSSVSQHILKALSPTLNYEAGQIASLPIIKNEQDTIIKYVIENIDLCKCDWSLFETSWDFKKHPLVYEVIMSKLISEKFKNWEIECRNRFDNLKKNEEEINKIFIETYGLQNELSFEVDDSSVSVKLADLMREIKSLLSYIFGISFGRYSLDHEGLCYAGGDWDSSLYSTIIPDTNNIIPILDDGYYADDAMNKVVEFVTKVYGQDTLDENLKFIADALGGNGTSKEVIRGYLLSGFYSDHLKTYQKRPIYWLFDAGKQNSFKALVYMHRYTPDLLANMRTDYILPLMDKYSSRIEFLEREIPTLTGVQATKSRKELEKVKAQLKEISEYEPKIHHLADERISIDLDDGVKHNYELFKDVLAPIK